MRRISLAISIAAFSALASLAETSAQAQQLDINPPIPNVLLLIDTSGSMENMINGKRPEAADAVKDPVTNALGSAACTPASPMAAHKMNRWATLLSVLTGTINNFSCVAVNRSSAAFKSEYGWNGSDPYDYRYYLDFHRITSNGCTPGPGSMTLNWDTWPANAIKYHAWNDANAACAAPGWQQLNDGILDVFRDRVRFGLMTFDTLPNPSTGSNGSLSVPQAGMEGMWSYYLNWQSGGSPATGNPPNCGLNPIEVGARNPSAPPWEGRLIPFGVPGAPFTEINQTNDRIQEALISMRPYGATPLAGMLSDAKDFLLYDTVHGSGNDMYFSGGCRKTYILVLSDGEPNLDLRKECETGNGKCPFQRPYEISHELATNPDPNRRVQTYAIGFGVSSAQTAAGPVDCKALTQFDLTNPNGKCSNATGNLAACCTLGRIAFEGGTDHAYFADDISSLKSTLSQVLADIAKGSTSRTVPVLASAGGATAASGNASAAGYQFVSSFDVPVSSDMWTGNLERKRYVCEVQNGQLGANLKPINESIGDRFHVNVNNFDAAHPRQLFTVIGTKQLTGEIYSRRSIRLVPNGNDGIGQYSGAMTGNNALLDGTAFAATLKVNSEALEIPPNAPPSACATRLSASDGVTCTERLIRWYVGENNLPHAPETRKKSVSCPECSVLGSIYHSTPVMVAPPVVARRDESYAVFASDPVVSKRPVVLYTATTDGQLHAFKVAASDANDSLKVDTDSNNELWSFIPPHVLPHLLPTYDQQAILLDGAPIVKDVVFERTQSQAIAGGSAGGAKWNTILLAGGGAGGGFYYALDITNPAEPKFLWQLATSDDGSPLFGKSAVTPAIATIGYKKSGDPVLREIAVAILPGGTAPLKAGNCLRAQNNFPNIQSPNGFAPRQSVRCWGESNSPTPGAARSISIVRLDTGEVLMNFRGAATDGPAMPNDRHKIVPFDSPITGIPVAFPTQSGQVADRIFVGDADGTLWRLDLRNPEPQFWSAELAWDGHSLNSDTPNSGEPIQTPPVISIDNVGNPVILFSTGDQETFTASNVQTRVWSISEKLNGTNFVRSENWVIPFSDGKRVTGPISLFDGTAYFATYTPPLGNNTACALGYGSVWGVHYIKKYQDDPAADPQLPPGAGNPFPQAKYAVDAANLAQGYVYSKDQAPGTTVFGVAIGQVPSCSDIGVSNDPFFGPVWSFNQASNGEYKLVYQTGKSGASSQGSVTNTYEENLPPPKQFVKIDSWASIVE